MKFDDAIDQVIFDAMRDDERIIVMGEDVHGFRPTLFARFGAERVRPTPISEAAFVSAGVGAAMAGLRPIVELMMVDFVGVAMDALLNHMAKLDAFSGGRWKAPMIVRAPCGGGYVDGGQHEQCLWGMIAGIPGLTVVVPSSPDDAAGLMKTALASDGPVIFLEHKLLSHRWLDSLGVGGRENLGLDVPEAGAEGDVDPDPPAIPFGRARVRRAGEHVTIASLAVGVHRALEAATRLASEGIEADVLDLRTLRPLDTEALVASVRKTNRLLVVDEDYEAYGLSGELAARVLEVGLAPRFARVCVKDTLPFARKLEAAALPNAGRIVEAARALVSGPGDRS